MLVHKPHAGNIGFFFQVQSLVRGAWFQNESWSDLAEGTDCRTQDIEGGTYHITIWCLKPDSWLKFWSQIVVTWF